MICIDEIHRYPNWAQELKNIYDFYKNIKIIFSGSSVIDLINQKYDLSRRAFTKELVGFSFREFLEIKLNQNLPKFNLKDLIKNRELPSKEIVKISKLNGYFNEYLKFGYYPIFIELKTKIDILETINGIIDKTINIDIASYYSLKTKTLETLKKILYFIHTSPPGKINPYRLAKSLNKDNKNVADYLDMLKESRLLNYLLIDKLGHALIKNAEKVFFNNTNLSFAIEYYSGKKINLGTFRETFVLNQLYGASYKPFYTQKADISIDKYIFEIGGEKKKPDQIKNLDNAYLVKDRILYGDKKSIPLWMFGFLY